MKSQLIWTLVGALAVLACGGAPVPQDQLTAAQAAVRAAEVGGAPEDPKASLHLKKANDQIQAAKALIADDENERAAYVLARAEADADLALALAREQQMRSAAQKAQAEVAEMKQELEEQQK